VIYCGDHTVTFSFGGHAFLAKLLRHFDLGSTEIVEAGAEASEPEDRLPGYEYRRLRFPFDRFERTRWSRWHARWAVANRRQRGRRIAEFLRLTGQDCLMTIAHDFIWIPVIEAARQTQAKVIVFCHDEWVELYGAKFRSKEEAKSIYGGQLRKATQVFSASEGMRRHLASAYGVKSKVFYPPRSTEQSGSKRQPQGNREKFRFTFCGQLWKEYWSSLREVAAVGMKHGWEIDILTNVPGQKVVGREFPNVRARDFLPEERLISHLQVESDALVIALPFGEEARETMETMFSSKMADYTMTGLPIVILAPPHAEMSRWGHEAGCFCLLDKLDRECIEKELIWFVGDEAGRSKMGQRAFELGQRLFSPERAKSEILSVMHGQRT
jgi:Glycosyl transferase 4-like domain